ncbi:UPF0047 protein YjbQ [Balamuthia mandrillaris]
MLGGWFQKTLQIKAKGRGCFLITDEVKRQLGSDLARFQVGIAHLFIQHTSASLTLNENWDSDVRLDMEDALNRLVPEEAPYRHTAEGSDDMPAHVKSSLFGASMSIPITNGSFNLGTWQGIWLCEHRDRPCMYHPSLVPVAFVVVLCCCLKFLFFFLFLFFFTSSCSSLFFLLLLYFFLFFFFFL